MNALSSIAPAAPTVGWADARSQYKQALAAEHAYDDAVWGPAYEVARVAGGPQVPDEIADEAERLQDVRSEAEDRLMEIPAPDGAGFALKYLIAHGDGREADCWDGRLEQEARHLLASISSHQKWLAEARRLHAYANEPGLDEAEQMRATGEMQAAEVRVIETPAASAADFLAKMLAVLAISDDGHDLDEVTIGSLMQEARTLGLMPA